jgi:hypothetical protein
MVGDNIRTLEKYYIKVRDERILEISDKVPGVLSE